MLPISHSRFSKVTDSRFVQPEKICPALTVFTLLGKVISVSDVHFANALPPTDLTPSLMVTDASAAQPENALSGISVTEPGIVMDFSDSLSANA